MKRSILLFIAAFLLSSSVGSKDFLPSGGTADTAKGEAKAYFDFSPLVYEYHSFKFTGSPVTGPDDVLAPVSDLYLMKSGLGVYTHSTNELYFSYSFKGRKDFIVTLKGADLLPRYKQGEAPNGKKPYFTTVTTVRFPAGYSGKGTTTQRKGNTSAYNALTVLPDTSIPENEVLFGTYGSLMLEVVATYHKPDGKLLSGNERPVKVTDGYEGVFTLECTMK